MKAFRPKTPGERATRFDPRVQAQMWERFWRGAKRLNRSWKGCMACPPERRDPTALIEIHHVISQQRLKRLAAERGLNPYERLKLLTDPRNSMVLDEWCHSGHTSGLRPISRESLPDHAWAFITDWGLMDEAFEEYPA